MREWPLRGELRSRKKASAKLRTCLSTLRIHIHKWTRSREKGRGGDRLKWLFLLSSLFLSSSSFPVSFSRRIHSRCNEIHRPERGELQLGAWFRFFFVSSAELKIQFQRTKHSARRDSFVSLFGCGSEFFVGNDLRYHWFWLLIKKSKRMELVCKKFPRTFASSCSFEVHGENPVFVSKMENDTNQFGRRKNKYRIEAYFSAITSVDQSDQ